MQKSPWMKVYQGALLVLKLIGQVEQQQLTSMDKCLSYNTCFPRASATSASQKYHSWSRCFWEWQTVPIAVSCFLLHLPCTKVSRGQVLLYPLWLPAKVCAYSSNWCMTLCQTNMYVWRQLNMNDFTVIMTVIIFFKFIYSAVHRTNVRANIYGLTTISVLTLRD